MQRGENASKADDESHADALLTAEPGRDATQSAIIGGFHPLAKYRSGNELP